MPDPAPNPELLRSLSRLVRGLSALFWGLPAALIICVGTASAGWFQTYGIVPPLVVNGLMVFGLWQIGAFQKQERPWRDALDRARLLALIDFGLSPFLYWWNRLPEQPFFSAVLYVLAFSAMLFLFNLNLVLQRLGAMLPDETLRHEIKQFTPVNRALLLATLAFTILFICSRFFPTLSALDRLLVLPERNALWWFLLLVLVPLAIFVLLPLAMTMALIWKTKEVILDSVFSAKS